MKVKSTHCKSGRHELSGDNLYVNPTTGSRKCKACMVEATLKRREIGVSKRHSIIEKICTRCGKTKTISFFSLHYSSKDGYSHYCKECMSEKRFIRRYGLSVKDIQELLVIQDNKCAICRVDFSDGKQSVVDHCHNTNAVRGILCYGCNTSLGLVNDSVEVLASMIAYVKLAQMDWNASRNVT